jgi:hypothetical protein
MSDPIEITITGDRELHGRLPGEEFIVEADENGRPVEHLWRKRVDEEARHGGGYIEIVGASDDAPSPPIPQIAPGASAQELADLEQRIMAALARALSGIRAEFKRISTGPDASAVAAMMRTELERVTNRVQAMVTEERTNAALVADAWRVRMAMPPDWRSGMPLQIDPPALIEAYAARHTGGDVGAAALEITDSDLQWQREAADHMRVIAAVAA